MVWVRVEPNFRPGFGSRRRISPIMSVMSSSSTPQNFLKEAMSRFAGPDPRRIHHLERDAEFLIELPIGVQVLEIVTASGRTGGDA